MIQEQPSREYIYEGSLNPHTNPDVLNTSPTSGIQIDIIWYTSLVGNTVRVDRTRHAKFGGCTSVHRNMVVDQESGSV